MKVTDYYFLVEGYELPLVIAAESLNKAKEFMNAKFGFQNYEALTKAQYERRENND